MVDRSLALLVTTGEDQGNGIEALYGLLILVGVVAVIFVIAVARRR